MDNTDEEKNGFISYGFRIKDRLPFSNGVIRTIIMKGPQIFDLLGKGQLDKVEAILTNDEDLDEALDQWVQWGLARRNKNGV